MIHIRNFDNCESSYKGYGGHSGSKKGVLLDKEKWILKYPKSTKSMDVEGISYTTAPLSEYLGSSIYNIIGINSHITELGVSDGKLVVACKDFLSDNEEILDFNSIKNDYNHKLEEYFEKRSSSKFDKNDDINDVIFIMKNNSYFKEVKELKQRFWDMFIIDAFINNNDRNETNWGLILNKATRELRVCPVYDNGAAFFSKSSDEKLELILKDDFKTKQAIYDNCMSSFSENGKLINSLKYIESMKNKDCNDALIRIFKKIDMEKINNIFNDVPGEYHGINIFSDSQRKFYFTSLEYKYNNVFKPIFDKLTLVNKK